MAHVAAFCAITALFVVLAGGAVAVGPDAVALRLDEIERALSELQAGQGAAQGQTDSTLLDLLRDHTVESLSNPEPPPALGSFSRFDSYGRRLQLPEKSPYLEWMRRSLDRPPAGK